MPNLSFGPPVIRRLRPLTSLPFDVHLMMAYPQRLLDAFAEAGADLINIHAECASPLKETLSQIRSLGKRAALTLKPATPAEAAFPYLEQLDMVLVMTVEPGFGGQAFMADMPVSYTHLDVYKRQTTSDSAASTSVIFPLPSSPQLAPTIARTMRFPPVSQARVRAVVFRTVSAYHRFLHK